MPKHTKAATASGMTQKQERFVAEYLIDGNGKRAAIAAGYSARTADRGATQLLMKPHVRAALDKARGKILHKLEITAERVLQEVGRVAFFDIRRIFNEDGSLKRVHELDDDTAAAIAAIEAIEVGGDGQLVINKKVKAVDKGAALDKLMRHLGMYEVDNRQRGELTVKDMTDDQLAARIKALQDKVNGSAG